MQWQKKCHELHHECLCGIVVEHKKWTLVTSMGCVHTHQKIPTIERCGNPSHVWNIMEKDGEDNRKVRKVDWIINQAPNQRPKHDKIRAQWVSDILSKNMLERVWWCKHFEMESWNRTICWPMNCSKRGRHARARGKRRSQVALKCCWKKKALLSTHVKALRRKGHWSPLNLATMMETTKAQFLK
jgi:hypothetical protein